MNVSLAVIGAGQMGSRHLQALLNLNSSVNIEVVEPHQTSLNTVQNLLNKDQPKSIKYLSTLDGLSSNLDLAIVATDASSRRNVVEKILEKTNVRYLILEKFLFQKKQDYADVSALLKKRGVKAWVNCPRRMWPFYQNLKERFINAEAIEFTATGSQMDLGCNSIHFLDLFSYLTDITEIELHGDCLTPGTLPSKRKGFSEFSGALYGDHPRGSFLVRSYGEAGASPEITISSNKIRCVINDTKKTALIATPESHWQWEKSSFETPFQSQLTHLAVEEILEKSTCALPPYEESARLHLILLKPLLNHIHSDICPIT